MPRLTDAPTKEALPFWLKAARARETRVSRACNESGHQTLPAWARAQRPTLEHSVRTDQSSTRDRGGWAHHVLVDDTYSMKPANLQDVSVNMRCGCELASRRGWPGRPTDRLGRDPRSDDLGRDLTCSDYVKPSGPAHHITLVSVITAHDMSPEG